MTHRPLAEVREYEIIMECIAVKERADSKPDPFDRVRPGGR